MAFPAFAKMFTTNAETGKTITRELMAKPVFLSSWKIARDRLGGEF
jgi:hypothetical protein